MNKYLLTSIILAIFLIVGHFISTHFGWYDEYGITDIILHTSSGILTVCLWIWLTEKRFTGDLFITCVAIIGVTLFVAFIWEVWEFGINGIIPKVFYNYIPTLSDSLSDMSCALLGSVIVTLFYWRKNQKV